MSFPCCVQFRVIQRVLGLLQETLVRLRIEDDRDASSSSRREHGLAASLRRLDQLCQVLPGSAHGHLCHVRTVRFGVGPLPACLNVAGPPEPCLRWSEDGRAALPHRSATSISAAVSRTTRMTSSRNSLARASGTALGTGLHHALFLTPSARQAATHRPRPARRTHRPTPRSGQPRLPARHRQPRTRIRPGRMKI